MTRTRLIALALIALAGCKSSTSDKPTTVKIGVFEPMTGANAAGGAMEVEGIKLANEMFPDGEGGRARTTRSSSSSWTTSPTRSRPRTPPSGSWTRTRSPPSSARGSSLSMAAGPIVKDKKVPAIALSATNPLVTKGNEYYFRVYFIDPFQGR